MFSKKSIEKVVSLALEKEKELNRLPLDSIDICISTGNSKIGKTMNISTMPILCCGNCDVCKAANRGCIAGETTYCNEH